MKNEANGPSSKRVRPGTEQLRARSTAVVDLPSAPQGTHRRQVRPQRPAARGPPRPPRGAEPAPHHGDSSGSLSLHRPLTGTSGAPCVAQTRCSAGNGLWGRGSRPRPPSCPAPTPCWVRTLTHSLAHVRSALRDLTGQAEDPPHPTPLPGRRPHARPPSVGWSASPDSRSPRLYLHQGGLPPARGGHTLEPRLHPSPPAQTAAWPQAPAPSHSFPCSNQGGLTTTLPTLPQTRLLPPDSRLCGPPAGPDPEPHQSCGRRSRLSWPFPSSGEGVL